jgi:hypothetical protein
LKLVAGTNIRLDAWAGVSADPADTGVTPSASNSLPSATGGRVGIVTAAIVPSISMPVKLNAIDVSSFPPAVVGDAIGGSLTGVTWMASVAGGDET